MPSRRSIYKKRRYARDPEYREKRKQKSRSFWSAHREKLNARRRARRRTDPEYRERQRGYHFRRYGLSQHDYEALSARQAGACAICRRKFRRPLGIDHCHVCNTVRGLLCSPCNTGLGMYGDDPDRMRAAIAYLEGSCRHGRGHMKPPPRKPVAPKTRSADRDEDSAMPSSRSTRARSR